MPRISVRDLIVNSLDETGLCSRNQPAPANIVVSALQLLKKRAAQYSNTNLLQFTRKDERTIPLQTALLMIDQDWNFYGYCRVISLQTTKG